MKLHIQRIVRFYSIMTVWILFQFNSLGQTQSLDWKRLLGPKIGIEALAVSPQNYLFFSIGNGYITYTTDHGNSFIQPREQPLADEILAFVFGSNGYLYCGLKWGGLIWSTDLGKSWIGGLYGDTGWGYLLVSSVAIHPKGILFAKTGTKGIQRSSDGGATWSRVGGASSFIFSGTIGITKQGDVLASSNDSIFVSTDQGDTWMFLNSIPTRSVWNFVSLNNGPLLAGTLEGDIFRSSNKGYEWLNVYSNPQHTRINGMVADTSGIVFAANGENGILRSTDYGISWQFENKGLTNLYVSSLAIDEQAYIYAGTNDWIFSSRYSLTNILHDDAHVYKSFFLSQNYPNPFTISTAIAYHLSSRDHVRLEVFDMLGRKVATLVDEEKEAGEYTVEFKIQNLIRRGELKIHSGMYFYRLNVGENVLTRKMIVIH